MKFHSGFVGGDGLGIATLRSIAGRQREFDPEKAAAAFGAVDGDLSAMGRAD